MRERNRILLHSIGALMTVSLATAVVAVGAAYTVSLGHYRNHLLEMVQRRARLMTEARHLCPPADPERSAAASGAECVRRMVDVYGRFSTFDSTGEFSIGQLEGDALRWLLRGRERDPDTPPGAGRVTGPGQPMLRAIRGEAGTKVGPGPRGRWVLAGYAPVPELGWGLVATIDLAEVNAPFVRAGLAAAGIGFVVVVGGVALMLRAMSPAVERIEARVRSRTAQLAKLNESLTAEISERKQTESELRRMSKVFMDAAAPILLLDLEGRITDVNAEGVRVYGWTRRRLVGQSLEMIMPADAYAREKALIERCVGGDAVRNTESWRRTRQGKNIPILLTLSRLTDELGTPVAVASIAKDLSQQVRLQSQLRAAAAEAALSEERERRKLALALHDGLGQLLAVVGMRLGMLRGEASGSELEPRVRELEGMITDAHGLSSSLSFQLSPPILHDVGIVPAAEWLADDIEKRLDLRVTVRDDGRDKPLDEATRITLFRGLSELLLNAARHAQVSEATVDLWREGDVVGVRVADEGVGFVPDEKAGGYGLLSIRERLNHLGGSVQIESEPGAGSRITLTGPVARAEPRRELKVL